MIAVMVFSGTFSNVVPFIVMALGFFTLLWALGSAIQWIRQKPWHRDKVVSEETAEHPETSGEDNVDKRASGLLLSGT